MSDETLPRENLPSGWWFLHFHDPNITTADPFIGACIIEGGDYHDAVGQTWRHWANPGGECRGVALIAGRVPPEPYRNRLLTADEVREVEAWARAKLDRNKGA